MTMILKAPQIDFIGQSESFKRIRSHFGAEAQRLLGRTVRFSNQQARRESQDKAKNGSGP